SATHCRSASRSCEVIDRVKFKRSDSKKETLHVAYSLVKETSTPCQDFSSYKPAEARGAGGPLPALGRRTGFHLWQWWHGDSAGCPARGNVHPEGSKDRHRGDYLHWKEPLSEIWRGPLQRQWQPRLLLRNWRNSRHVHR